MCYFNRSFHFTHISCIMFLECEWLTNFWYGFILVDTHARISQALQIWLRHDILFLYSLKPYFFYISFIGRLFLKCYCHVWILKLVSPLHGDIVYLDISSLTTSILSIFHSQQTPFDNLFLWGISELTLFTVSCLWIVCCF